ncbi:hypothetical protein PEM37_06280 [Streptomyces sp. AD681]|uniref:hypothetical protein n=1 Tax=Streptomyces sp. AD681 TaxID=3019069 RepID=UPI0022F15568|nr:hypothetical protein [Streptomyces sp. AD681]MDA5141108.1 hypothetical protein [Streptomyces sp. AD681]
MSVDQESWEVAVRHLYEDAYPYDATGPRRHEDWVLDVLALMARVPDPRGWSGLDDAAQMPERETSPTYPFAVHSRDYVAPRLQEIDRNSAENLLLALTNDCCTLSNLKRFTESEDELRDMTRTILARYGDGAHYHTNVNMPGHVRGCRLHVVELCVQPAQRLHGGLRPDRRLGHRGRHVLELLRLLSVSPPVTGLRGPMDGQSERLRLSVIET